MRAVIDSTILKKIKKEASKLKKRNGITHTEALDVVAKNHKFEDYSKLLASYKKNASKRPIGR